MSKITLKTLLAIGLGLVASAALADSYGVSNSTASNATQTTPASGLNADNGQVDQQAVIDQLLKNANAKSSSAMGHANANKQSATSSTTSTSSNASDATNPGVDDEAFSNTVRNMLPLSPEQIKTLRKMFDDSQRAVAASPTTPPKPTAASVIVDLSPGATPPVVRLQSGFVTSLVFLDSTGAPWPVKAFDLGDPGSFNIQWDKKGNTLLVQALTQYKEGNIAVMLKGMDTPVMLMLMPGQKAADYRVDLRLPGLGPQARPVLDGLPSTTTPELLSLLDGVPPQGAKSLKISGAACQGWRLRGHIYLRTRLTVVSPAWIATMSSPDGTHVYEMQNTPVVLGSDRGKLVKLTIEGL